jgi:O-antigen/teichoic acid export membrane protein
VNDSSLRRRLAKGLGAQGYAQALNVVIQVSSVPLFLHAWGTDLYGEWLLLTAVPVYLAMSDVGFSTAATNEMTIAFSRGDSEGALESFQSAWVLTLGISLVLLLAVVPAALLLPLGSWLRLPRLGSTGGVGPVFVLLSVQVLTGLQTGLVYAGFHCVGKYGLGLFLMSSVRMLEFGLLALAVLSGGGPIVAAAAFAGGRLGGTLVMGILLRRATPWLSFGYRHAAWPILRRLARPAVAFTAFPLGNALNVQGMLLVVGAMLGPAAAVVFNTLRTMTRVGVQLTSAIRAAVSAEISAAFGAGNRNLLRQLHHQSCQAALWLAILLALALGLFGRSLLSVWTHGRVPMNIATFVLLLAGTLPNSLWLTSLNLAYATNRHERLATMYVVANVIMLLSALAVAAHYHLVGVALVLLLGEIGIAVFVLRTSLKSLDEKVGTFARALVTVPRGVLRESA